MAKVASAQRGILLVELASQRDIFVCQRPHFDTGSDEQGHCGIERLESPDQEIGMHQLLTTSAKVQRGVWWRCDSAKNLRAESRSGCGRPTAYMKTFVSTKITC